MAYNSINIVIPVYNEGQNISLTLMEIKRKVRTPYEVIIVYDLPQDTTIPFVKEHIEQGAPVRLVANKYGRGALNAIKTGFDSANQPAVLVMMADLADDLEQIDKMWARLNEGADIVCGSRYMKGGKQIGGPWFKKLLSRLAGVSLHYLIGIPTHDITNSFKMYTRKVLSETVIESSGGFELGMEIVVKAFLGGYKIAEVPAVWRDRQAGQSRFRLWKWLPGYLRWYFFAFRGRWGQVRS